MTLSEEIEKMTRDDELAFYKAVAKDDYGVNADDCNDIECVIKKIKLYLSFKHEDDIQQLREDLKNKYKKTIEESMEEIVNEISRNNNNLTL